MSSTAMTVALVSTQRRWHGGEEQARLLAVGLRRRGCRCVVLARRGSLFAERMADEGFEVVTFSGGRGPAALWRIRRALRRVRPDVLHYNDSHAIGGAGLASLGLQIPARIAARRVDFTIRSPKQYRWFCDCVVCVSGAVADVCREGGIPDRLLRVVHDGVDPARVRSGDRARGRQALSLNDDQTLLLTVATLTDHKGHRFLLEALPEVVRKAPNTILALAGDGDLQAALQRQAERLAIDSHVRFLGFRDDVPDLIHAADLFVLPSHKEGLCSTLIDVMLADCPIVATTAGGIPDLVGARKRGQAPFAGTALRVLRTKGACPLFRPEESSEPVAWLVPPRDPRALARAILHALDSPDQCAAMRRRALHRAEQRFTADRMVESTLAVYRELIAKPQAV
ncbi:MAG: glycosyltransferase [Planctomycetes bacterium]|nr:glycosyltransferase [Planctomycetota bacterium]MCG2683337.1 glycosyltransferase [Planctomycetales bacterium]